MSSPLHTARQNIGRIHLINPSHVSFGIGVITPRWLFVLAGATPEEFGTPILTDETLEQIEPGTIHPGDIVGIGIHSGNVLRGYEVGRLAREAGATVIYGGIHTTLYPEEPRDLGGAHAIIKGDGEGAWPAALADCARGALQPVYEGGRIEPEHFVPARWDLLEPGRYMWGSVQTVRGCPKHCSFCSVWRTDGQRPRQRGAYSVVDEVVELRRRGFRFVALADDNFYPVTLEDLRQAERRQDRSRLESLLALRAERFTLMEQLAQLPDDMVFFTQITMEAAEDPEFLDAMRRARIKGALVGVEAVTPEGLKDIYKDFNESGEDLVKRLRAFRDRGVHVLGSFIFGLPSDRPSTFEATLDVAKRAGITFAQFVMLTPFPGTLDFAEWEKTMATDPTRIAGVPLTRHWLIPQALRPKVYMPHPTMSGEEIRERTQKTWDHFYSLPEVWKRSKCVKSLKSRLAFLLISKIYRQMYANTGIATDSARVGRSARWARLMIKPCQRLFTASPMPDLQAPAPAVVRALRPDLIQLTRSASPAN
jgi:tRNA A37 methylthiotransferase MiaB